MKANREKYPHLNAEEFKEFIGSLKPMEVTELVDALVKDNHIPEHPALTKQRIQRRLVEEIADLQETARVIDELLSGKES